MIGMLTLLLFLNLLITDANASIECKEQATLDQTYGVSCMSKGLKADITDSQSCLSRERERTSQSCHLVESCMAVNIKLLPGQFLDSDDIIWSFAGCYQQSMRVQVCADLTEVPPKTVAPPCFSATTSSSKTAVTGNSSPKKDGSTTTINTSLLNSSAAKSAINGTSSSSGDTASTKPTSVANSNFTLTTADKAVNSTLTTNLTSTTIDSATSLPTLTTLSPYSTTPTIHTTSSTTDRNIFSTGSTSSTISSTASKPSISNINASSANFTISTTNSTILNVMSSPDSTTSTVLVFNITSTSAAASNMSTNGNSTNSSTTFSLGSATNQTDRMSTATDYSSAYQSTKTASRQSSTSFSSTTGKRQLKFEGCFTGSVTFASVNCSAQVANVTLAQENMTAEFQIQVLGCCSTNGCKPTDGKPKPNTCNYGTGKDVVSVSCASQCFTYFTANSTSSTSNHGCLDDLHLSDTPFHDVVSCTESYEQGSCLNAGNDEVCLKCCTSNNCNNFDSKNSLLGIETTTTAAADYLVFSSLVLLFHLTLIAAI